jgi:anti-anti-sigma factor
MRLEKSVNEEYATLKLLDEKLDSRNAADLKKELLFLFEAEGMGNIVLNMSNVAYADSSGLSALLMGNRAAKGIDGIMVVCELNEAVQSLVRITKLNEVLTILPTEDEAREAIFMHVLESGIEDDMEAEEGEAASFS